jgi:UDP-N-acetylmuramate dehydrogenase
MTRRIDGETLLGRLPKVRGRLEPNFPLADLTWFRAGGPAEVLFTPADEDDLSQFMKHLDESVPVYPIGVGSNLLVRDGGVPGVVIRLGRGFGQLEARPHYRILAGAAIPDVKVARFALDQGIGGLTFLRGIPGTIGGALRMNGGAYGGETKDILVEAYAIDRGGRKLVLPIQEMCYSAAPGNKGRSAGNSGRDGTSNIAAGIDAARQNKNRRVDLQKSNRSKGVAVDR